MNAKEPIKQNSPLIEKYQIPGSPYWIIGEIEKGYNLRFGKYKFTENMESIQEVEEHYEVNKANIILQTILAVTNETMEAGKTINPQ